MKPAFAVKEEACAAGDWMKEGRSLPPVDFWHGPPETMDGSSVQCADAFRIALTEEPR